MTARKDKKSAYFLIANDHVDREILVNELMKRHMELVPQNKFSIIESDNKKLAIIKVPGGHKFWRDNLTQIMIACKDVVIGVYDQDQLSEAQELVSTSEWSNQHPVE
jgi:hypothetical protein